MKQFDPASLTFNDAGLIPAIAQDAENGRVLMMAWMNRSAVEKTLATKKVTYWSRSRQAFWIKGETSGNMQTLVSMDVDCDRDCILMQVTQVGPACHTNRPSCFFTRISDGPEVILDLPVS